MKLTRRKFFMYSGLVFASSRVFGMEQEQFNKLVKLFKESNAYLENISSRLSGIDNCLDLIKEKLSEGVKVTTKKEYKKYT